MDFSYKYQILFLLSLYFLLVSNIIQANMKSSKSYFLTKDCQSMNEKSEYGTKLMLKLNLTGAFIKSHIDYLSETMESEGYPDNFFCEIVAEASPGHVIMLLIESLYIPALNSLCDENYLYVFDYRSSRSKAMASAGGEKGLCDRVFPRFPIFTTGPFITIVFKSNLRDSLVPQDAGFQFTLTQVQQTDKNNACKAGQYRCNNINLSAISNDGVANAELQKRSRKDNQFVSVTKPHENIPQRSITPIVNYCIPLGLICDGIKNCHDASDEDATARRLCLDVTNKSVINQFLSLGLSASIAIAVSCTIAATLCIGITVCYCIKLCTSRLQPRPSQFTKGVNAAADYQPANSFPPILPVNHIDAFCAPYIGNQSSQFVCIKDTSASSSSFEPDKIYCLYQEPQLQGYSNMSALVRPASEKICHWTSSSMASYPSTSEGHHSHPETPCLRKKTAVGDHSPSHRMDNKHRSSNVRGHTNSYNHHTPTSSRSAKSTRSTKSSNVDKKSLPQNGSEMQNPINLERIRKYPIDNNRIMALGPVLGEL